MLRWCRDNGLLGLLHHELIAVETRARWEHGDRGTPVAIVRGYRRTGFGWRATAREIEGVVPPKDIAEGEELSAEVVRAGVPAVTSTLPIWMVMRMGNGLAESVAPFGDLVVLRRALRAEGDFVVQRMSGDWIDYFDPDAPLRYPSWPLPAPDSEDFWRQYSEPLTDFLVNAWTLGHALGVLERQNPDHKPLPDEKREIGQAWSVINSLASAVAPTGRYVAGSHHLGWNSPSLLGSYATMILSRLAGGAEIRICPACRSPFHQHGSCAVLLLYLVQGDRKEAEAESCASMRAQEQAFCGYAGTREWTGWPSRTSPPPRKVSPSRQNMRMAISSLGEPASATESDGDDALHQRLPVDSTVVESRRTSALGVG